MTPFPIEPCTRRMISPSGMEDECNTLEINETHDPIWGNLMRSAWMPDDEERAAIASGAPVILSIVGTSHPVVAISTGVIINAE